MKNAIGRKIPEYIEGYGKVTAYSGAFSNYDQRSKKTIKVESVPPGINKVLSSIDETLDKCRIQDGMTISFHHHLRNGDHVLNMVMEAIAKRGVKDIRVAASSLFPIHEPLVKHIDSGVVTGIYANYISGPVGEAITKGKLKYPAVMHSHGGRSRAIESGDLTIDIAFIAAPTSDTYGNINTIEGKSACGVLGYAVSDALYADRVVAVTDHLVEYPATSIEISQEYIDYVVSVESIGDIKGIVSGTTNITKDPVGLKIAKQAAQLIDQSGMLKDGVSFQTGAGSVSLAVAAYMKEHMKKKNVTGSFASGGITGYLVEMFEEGLFKQILDVQCFDLRAIASYKKNINHQKMSASMYGNPHNKGAVVNNLDIMILGATEIDRDFNVNVTTDSNGMIMGGSGGHNDTAAGSKLAIVATQLVKGRTPIFVDRVTTATTPGETVDVLVTERGIVINPKRTDLTEKLKDSSLPIMTIEELKTLCDEMAGKPDTVEFEEKITAVIEYRDGSVIDVVRKPKG